MGLMISNLAPAPCLDLDPLKCNFLNLEGSLTLGLIMHLFLLDYVFASTIFGVGIGSTWLVVGCSVDNSF